MKERDCTNCIHHTADGCSSWDCEFEAKDLISRADAINAICGSSVYAWSVDDDKTAHDWALSIINALPSADAVSGYTEWLEKIIVDAETIEWLCEDTNDKEWCDNNCHYSSIQAECLRHLYEVSKGGDTE